MADEILIEKSLADATEPNDAHGQVFMQIIDKASNLPIVRVDRFDFLRKQFSKKYGVEVINKLRTMSPKEAGISNADIEKAAKGSISLSATTVTAISTAAGIPGGLAMIGTIPADLIQFYGHVLNIMQKLMYIYGWGEIKDADDNKKNTLIIFLGVMSGVQGINSVAGQICTKAAIKAESRIQKAALTKTMIYPIVKKVAKILGYDMTKEVFAKGVSKAIPIVGGVISGGVTFASFRPMCSRLQKVLRENS